jgi:hypothetical protein
VLCDSLQVEESPRPVDARGAQRLVKVLQQLPQSWWARLCGVSCCPGASRGLPGGCGAGDTPQGACRHPARAGASHSLHHGGSLAPGGARKEMLVVAGDRNESCRDKILRRELGWRCS